MPYSEYPAIVGPGTRQKYYFQKSFRNRNTPPIWGHVWTSPLNVFYEATNALNLPERVAIVIEWQVVQALPTGGPTAHECNSGEVLSFACQ